MAATPHAGPKAPDAERSFWNRWNHENRETRPLDEPSEGRAAFILSAVRQYASPDARVVDLGCGTGWLSERVVEHVASVTAVDLADEVIARARARASRVQFLAGSAMTVPTDGNYDAVVCDNTFAHVADQAAFVERMADLLKPDGWLFLTTQNRTVFVRSRVMPLGEGQVRQWVTRSGLRRLVAPRFRVVHLATIQPNGDRGILRWLNGRKTSQVWNSIFGTERWRSIRERAGLGQTITLVAQKL